MGQEMLDERMRSSATVRPSRSSIPVRAWPVLLVIALALLVPAVGSARTSVKIFASQLSSRRLVPGRTVVLQAAVPTGSWCRLSLTNRDARSASSSPRRASSGLGQFTWQVPSNVASGRWTAKRSIDRGAPS